ncbi:hypothetical protein ACT89R_17295 [Rhodococcus qingshengii]
MTRFTAIIEAMQNKHEQSVGKTTTTSSELSDRIEQVNSDQVPALIEVDGHRAWIVPERLWNSIQSIAFHVNDPVGAKELREKRRQDIRDEAERLANDPDDLAETKAIQDFIYGNQ